MHLKVATQTHDTIIISNNPRPVIPNFGGKGFIFTIVLKKSLSYLINDPFHLNDTHFWERCFQELNNAFKSTTLHDQLFVVAK